jgi:hypothetical protein
MSGGALLVQSTFAPAHGRTFYLVGEIRSGALRIGMKLVLPLPVQSPIDVTIRTVEHTAEPAATCIGIRYRDARERADLLALDLVGRLVSAY